MCESNSYIELKKTYYCLNTANNALWLVFTHHYQFCIGTCMSVF